MQSLRTCSDDEDFIAVGGCSESSADTDDLIGNVDWAMNDGSDEEMERYGCARLLVGEGERVGVGGTLNSGEQKALWHVLEASWRSRYYMPCHLDYVTTLHTPRNQRHHNRTIVRHSHPAAAPAAAAGPAQPPAPSQLDHQDWMFDIRVGTAGRAVAGGAGGGGASGSAAVTSTTTAAPAAVNPAAMAVGWATVNQQQSPQPQAPRQQHPAAAPAAIVAVAAVRPAAAVAAVAAVRPAAAVAAVAAAQPPQGLPGDLDSRLDRLLLDFTTGGGTSAGSAAAMQRQRRGSDDGIVVGVERISLAAGAGSGVRFANSLPPPQDNFTLEYSDFRAAAWLRGDGSAAAAAAAPPLVAAAAGGTSARGAAASSGAPAAPAARSGNGVPAAAAAAAPSPPPRSPNPRQVRFQEPPASPPRATTTQVGGWRIHSGPVARGPGGGSVAADPGDMFSFRRRPAGPPGQQQQPTAMRARHPAMG